MAQLSLSVLGPFQALLDDQPVTGFESARVRGLLVYLAVEKSRPHHRETLVELFWPEQPRGAGAANLRHALANLRKAIGDSRAAPPFLLITPETLQFNPASNATLDLDRFFALLANDPTLAARQAALALYRGHLLEGFTLDGSPDFELWLTVLRERVDYLVSQTLAALVAAAVQQGDFAQAVSWTQRQLALDALNEDVHLQLIWLLAHSGQRAAALHHYQLCAELLRKELAVAPQETLHALVARIRAGSPDLGVIYGQDGQVLAAPVKSVTPSTSLPMPSTPFIGRARELALVAQRLADPGCHLLTIVGPGGIGKTRLALQAAAAASASFPQGVYFIELVAVATVDQMPGAILAGLGALHASVSEPLRHLQNHLRQRRLLLVLDNFEHLLDGAALLVELVRAAPLLKLLVTSRARLNLREEWLVPLEGLDLPLPLDGATPPEEALPISLDDLDRYDAPRLFLHCVRRLQPAFLPTPDEAAAILHICRLLEGMPLAIELAAAWVRTLPLPAIVREMAHSLTFLSTSLQDTPTRHRSMSAVFDHSWRLLTANERSILRQLSVFRGGCTRAAGEAVSGAQLTELAALVDKSWLRARPDGRYELHELVRQYCAEKLEHEKPAAEAETADQVRSRHGAYFANYLAGALQKMNYRQEAMPEVVAEIGNILEGLHWSARAGNVEAARQMIIGLFFVAEMLGWYQFALQTYDAAIVLLSTQATAENNPVGRSDQSTLILCWLHWCQASLYRTLGRLERANTEVERVFKLLAGVTVSRHQRWLYLINQWLQTLIIQLSGDLPAAGQSAQAMLVRFQNGDFPALFYSQTVEPKFWQAHVYALLGLIAWQLGEYGEAQQQVQRALALRDEMGEQRYKALNLITLATVQQTVGELAEAALCIQQALHLSQTGGDEIAHAHALAALARLEREQGMNALAHEHARLSLTLGKQSGNHRLLMEALVELGYIALTLGQTVEAREWLDEALVAFAQLATAHSNYVAGALLGLGWTALADREFATAEHYFRQTLASPGAAAWELLDAVAGMAEVATTEGRIARAAELFSFVRAAPGASHATRQRASQQLSALVVVLPADTFSAARARGQAWTQTALLEQMRMQ